MTTYFSWSTSFGMILGAVALAGCGGKVIFEGPPSGTGGGGAGGSTSTGVSTGNGAGCPDSPPSPGSSCSIDGLTCFADHCGDSFVCHGGEWQETGGTGCAEACPEQQPNTGDPCDSCCQDECSYPTTCGETQAFCENGTWMVSHGGDCPIEPCLDIGDQATCAGSGHCQWLEPGCGSGLQIPEGCYETGDCMTQGCLEGGQCTVAEYNPCADSNCNVCSGPINVCTFLGD